MAFNIRMGLPEMEVIWHDLSTRGIAHRLRPVPVHRPAGHELPEALLPRANAIIMKPLKPD